MVEAEVSMCYNGVNQMVHAKNETEYDWLMYNRHLDTFIQVADSGSFSKAAEKMYISPNAVIKQINILESHLGLKLFIRSNHGLQLTEVGELIYRDAKFLIRYSQKTLEQARALSSIGEKLIRVGSSLLKPSKTVVSLWKEVNKLHPEIKIQIIQFDDQHENYLDIVTHFGEKIDIISGIFPSTRYGNQCNTLELERYPLCCALSFKHPLANRKSFCIEDLYGEKLIMVVRGDTSYVDALRDEIEENHPLIEIIDVPYYDISTFNRCESSNAIMITAENWKDIHPSLVTIPVDWGFYVPHGLIYSLHPSEQVRMFIEAVQEITKK